MFSFFKLSSKVAVPFAFPPAMNEFCHPTFSPEFGVDNDLDFGHSNRYVVVSHWCFNLQFPNDIRCGASLSMLLCHLYVFFGEVSVQVFANFYLGCLLSFKSYLYILNNSPFSDVTFANAFSQVVACLLTMLILLSFEILLLHQICGLESYFSYSL